ncbi:hypothetical protein [uncultured Gilliamella sp.]|uniref:hypothetical protein n=1 Tax=uncultured Gilliamella sp. TaxID=1193505 RepID=UPI0025DF0FE5|nr:hypothetical protein [uncultured Gilliamella sp.]
MKLFNTIILLIASLFSLSVSANQEKDSIDNNLSYKDFIYNNWDSIKEIVADKIFEDCHQFWNELEAKNSQFIHFEHCEYDAGDQGTPLVIKGWINGGIYALSAEKWLLDKYHIARIERLVGGWGSDSLFANFNNEKDVYLRIIISSTERPDVRDRKDWDKISKFEITFIKYPADAV